MRDGSARCCWPLAVEDEAAGADILGIPFVPGPKLDEASISASPSLGMYAASAPVEPGATPGGKSEVAGAKNALDVPPSSAKRDNDGKVEVREGAETATDGSEDDDCEVEAFSRSRSLSRSLSRRKGLLASEGRRRKVDELGSDGVGRLAVRPAAVSCELLVETETDGAESRRDETKLTF